MTTPMNDHANSDPKMGQTSLDSAHNSTDIEKPKRDDLAAWTDRMREGMARMANDEAERVKVARRLF